MLSLGPKGDSRSMSLRTTLELRGNRLVKWEKHHCTMGWMNRTEWILKSPPGRHRVADCSILCLGITTRPTTRLQQEFQLGRSRGSPRARISNQVSHHRDILQQPGLVYSKSVVLRHLFGLASGLCILNPYLRLQRAFVYKDNICRLY